MSEGDDTVSVISSRCRTSAAQVSSATDSVKVICRVRPFSKREYDLHQEQGLNSSSPDVMRPVVRMEGNDTVFLDPETYTERERFPFDHSLWSVGDAGDECEFATQEVVMRTVGLPAVAHVWAGYHVSVFAYGQTGSGKTFTMMGDDDAPGLIPRMCQAVFHELEVMRSEDASGTAATVEGTMKEYRLEAHFLEIYNDKVKDLLWALRSATDPTDGIDHENLRVRHTPNLGPMIIGLTNVEVNQWEDCLRLIEEGTKHRSVAATKMNATSSRSHSIFRLRVVQVTTIVPTRPYERPKSFERASNVSLVDLAGSERNKKTGAQGDRLREAVAINKSLTTLKNVIDALVEGRPVVPYRDSQLTFLLSESLGGNSKTFMIACISPHSDNADETLNTLRYALRAQGIACHAVVNESEEMRKVNLIRLELEALRQKREDPQDALASELRRESEGKREQIASMKHVSAQQQELEEQLQRDVVRSAELRTNSKYQSAFRLVLARRVEAKCQAESEAHRTRIQQLRSSIEHAEKDLHQAALQRSTAVKAEGDARTLYKAREREWESLRSRNSALEWRKRTLMRQDEQLRLAAETKMNLKPTIALVMRCLVGHRLLTLQKAFAAAVEDAEQSVREAQDGEEQSAELLRTKQRSMVAELADEATKLKSELSSSRHHVAELQQQLQRNVKALHAECIFLETEIKELTEQHEKTIAALNKSKAASYFAAKEEWTARLQRYAVEKQQELQTLEEKIHASLSNRRRNDELELSRLEAECNDAMLRVEQTSAQSIDTLHATHRQLEKRMEAWSRESLTFLSRFRSTEPSYRRSFERITSVSTGSADAEMLLRVLESQNRRSDAIVQLSQKLTAEGVHPSTASSNMRPKPSKSPSAGTSPSSSSRQGKIGGVVGPTRSTIVSALPQPKSRSPAASKRAAS